MASRSREITLADYKRLTEKAWMGQVLELARFNGWFPCHTWNSIHSAKGFPDLVLLRERIVFAELKSETGKVTAEQRQFLDRLLVAGAEVYIWRPDDFQSIVEILSKKA